METPIRRFSASHLAIVALVLTAAVVGLAVASPNAPTRGSAEKTASKALKKAKQAIKKAKAAQTTADQAAGKVAGITEVKAGSATLSSGGSQDLFTVGNVTLTANCMTPVEDLLVEIVAEASEPGAVATSSAPIFESTFELTPGVPKPIIEQGSNGNINGASGSFTIFDGPRTASGVGSITADKNQDECQARAHVVR